MDKLIMAAPCNIYPVPDKMTGVFYRFTALFHILSADCWNIQI